MKKLPTMNVGKMLYEKKLLLLKLITLEFSLVFLPENLPLVVIGFTKSNTELMLNDIKSSLLLDDTPSLKAWTILTPLH